MKKTAVVWQEKIQKSTNRRMEVIQGLSPDFVPSLELIELMRRKKDMGGSPGPGTYNYPNPQGGDNLYQFF